MAQRRMFSLKIIDTDKFLDMPKSSQLLYFHLSMRADDDGFVNSPKKIQRIIGCSDDDFKVLMAKQYLIPFESGVCVIKDWKIHNYIQKDRYQETMYHNELQQLTESKDGSYTKCIQNVSISDTQVRDRLELGKSNIVFDFEFFWSVYPRKIEKQKALKRFSNICKSKNTYDNLIIAVRNYANYTNNQEAKYIKHCATWLSNWEDWLNYTPEVIIDYNEIWEQVLVKMRNTTSQDIIKFEDKKIEKALDSIGGMYSLRTTTMYNLENKKKEFIGRYKELSNNQSKQV